MSTGAAVRILIVNTHMDDIAGGSETQCHEIATALADRGHAVTYAVCLSAESERRDAQSKAERLGRPYAIHLLRGAFRETFERALDETAPDVIYWRYNKRHLLPCVLTARRRGIKFVFAVSHINDVKAFAVKPFYGGSLRLARRALRVAGRMRDSVLGALNYCALHLIDLVVFQHAGQVPHGFRRPHAVIYNSVPRTEDPLSSAERSSKPYVLWIANLKKSKNPEEFVRLAGDLEHTGVEFRMVGNIQDPAYRQLVESPGLPRSFRYVGLQSRAAVDALIRDSLFVVHTCDPEGFPNVFIQAWAQGKTVVSLRFDPGALLSTHRIGLCSGDYETFKQDVARLIAEPDLRQAMAARAQCFAAEHCDRSKNVEQLERAFSRLVGTVPT